MAGLWSLFAIAWDFSIHGCGHYANFLRNVFSEVRGVCRDRYMCVIRRTGFFLVLLHLLFLCLTVKLCIIKSTDAITFQWYFTTDLMHEWPNSQPLKSTHTTPHIPTFSVNLLSLCDRNLTQSLLQFNLVLAMNH